MFEPRSYQVEAISNGIEFFTSKQVRKFNSIQILPTGSGKSVVIANIAKGLEGKTLVLQPSKEILIQNVRKYMSYGFHAGVYSASVGQKHLEKVTFATIGSITRKMYLFMNFQNVIIDECHLVNSQDGMYRKFFDYMKHARFLGLTATPYRLTTSSEGAELRFLTRTSPRLFNKVNYFVQNDILFEKGHLAKLEYYSFNVVDRTMLDMNSSGTDFTESSLRAYYRTIDMPGTTIHYANRLLKKRKNLLIFCSLIDEANKVAKGIPGAVVISGETEGSLRDRIIKDFTTGKIKCVVNVGVLTTGFDYPELETVLISRSTMSLALYYQIIGRVMRPHKSKASGWVVDLGGNIDLFGKIETMRINQDSRGLFYISNNGRQLTNVPFRKAA